MRSLLSRITSNLTIRQQTGLVFGLGLFVLAVLAATFIAEAAEKRIEERLRKQGQSIATALATNISLSPEGLGDDYRIALPILSLPHVSGITIYGEEGNQLFQRGAPIPGSQDLLADTHPHWYFFERIGQGQGSVAVALDKAAVAANSAGILQSNLIASLVSAVVMLVLVLLITGRIVNPLQTLSSAMDRARRGEYDVRARLTGSRELLAMSQAFNTMMYEQEARQRQLLRARDAALVSSRIKGDFASALSHELRTPMNGVMGMLDLLHGTTLDTEQQEYLDIARSSGRELLRLIEASLEMARSGAGKQELNISDFAPQTLVAEVGKLLEHKARQKNLALSWEVDAAVPATLKGDAGRIRQVLLNLVGNALKFTAEGSIHVQAGLAAGGRELSITVTDTGEGIPREAQHRIFEPYVQLNDTQENESNGTGLGLFICSELIRSMGGKIGVDSEPGKGSRFWFTVPLKASRSRASQAPQTGLSASSAQPAHGPHILVVDDDAGSRRQISGLLKEDGYQVAAAHGGPEALEYCRQYAPDLILMDALLPMDNLRACQEVFELNGQRAPQILMITSPQDDSNLEQALAAGATDFITKPINATILRQRVQRMLHIQKVDHHLHQLSNFDQLTGLPNRAAFVEEAQQLLAEADQQKTLVALLFIDLDRFKVINETRGHEVGDALLQRFGKLLKSTMRERDVVSRLSGDIFTVLLDKVRGVDGAIAAANKVLALAKQPFDSKSRPVYLSASIGISMYPRNGSSMTELMRQADAAMYRAKSRGGNTFEFYQPGMELAISQEIELEIGLRDALEQDQLVLHYQPQVALPQGQLIGLEALVRWQHPQRGLLLPKEFIPLAEKTGLIGRIDEWVMREACRQLRRWMDADLTPVPIAVNVSGGELADNNLVTKVKSCLEETHIPAKLLKLEITEDTLASSSADTTALLQELRALGITLAIDDFGTGYSSLSYLKLFPVDTLKIDRSFISDLPDDSNSAAIVSGIITLGHNLKLTIVAEGAETAEQRAFLEQAKCDAMQGFVVSRPLPATEVEEWLAKAMQAEGVSSVVEPV